ncbi:MAG: 2-dehydropantoate 2-reductase [Bacteroidota bacterium]
MRILVLGAGATGGYFGGRMVEAGCDVTFLVRPARAERLRGTGLVVESPLGDIRRPVRAITADALAPDYDVVLLSCKAFDLDDAVVTITPAMAADTKVLPVLNGMSHLDRLDAAFGAPAVLGGLCQIAATLAPDGTVRHLNQAHALLFGHRSEAQRVFCEQLQTTIMSAKIDVRRSDAIVHEMWEKWVMLATLAACTCLMRSTVGDIVAAAGGERFILATLDEAQAIAAANGHAATPKLLERVRTMLTERGSGFAASMLRDLEAGGRIEADHIVGDLLRRGEEQGIEAPLLRVAWVHLKAYEARRERLAIQTQAQATAS